MKTIEVTYELLEPVLVTAPGGDPNTDESLGYLSGSAIRGALIGRYLNGESAGEEFSRLFLSGKTRFLNAYPLDVGQSTQPLPTIWRREKDGDNRVYDLRREQPKLDERLKGQFFRLQRNEIDDKTLIVSPEIHWVVTLHTSRNRKAGRALREDGNVYRYRALAAGQRFAGQIIAQNEGDATILHELLAGGDLLLGGAQTAGYGRVRVSATVGEAKPAGAETIAAGIPITLYFASDAILRHPVSGQTGPFVTETLNSLLPNKGFRLIDGQFGRFHWVGGFNRTWGLPLPQTWAVEVGSTYTIVATQPVAVKELEDIADIGLGERTAEGFGTVVFNPEWATNANLYVLEERRRLQNSDESNQIVFPVLSEDESYLIDRMNWEIAETQLNRLVVAKAHEVALSHKGTLLSKSQYGRLSLRLRAELDNSADFTELQKYLYEANQRKTVRDQFKRSRIGEQMTLEWLARFVGKKVRKEKEKGEGGRAEIELETVPWSPNAIWEILDLQNHRWRRIDERWERDLLGATPYSLDKAAAHRLTIRLLSAVIDQLAKKRGGVL